MFTNEIIDYEHPFLSIKVFESQRNRNHMGKWHYHKEVEMLAVLEGKLEVHVEDDVHLLGKGDVILIGSSQLHRDRSFKDWNLRYIVFQFDMQAWLDQSTMPHFKYFAETREPLGRLNYIFREKDSVRKDVLQWIQDIFNEWKDKQRGYEMAVTIKVKSILLSMLRHDDRNPTPQENEYEMIRIRPALEFIQQRISRKIRIEEAAKLSNMSYYYFVKYFKKATGMTFTDYVHFRKIKLAEKLLLTEDGSITSIGEQIGMPNMAHFYKVFRKYNACSPHEFRQKMLKWGG